jgi:hypothetical protein
MLQGLWPQGSGVRIPSLTLMKIESCEESGELQSGAF